MKLSKLLQRTAFIISILGGLYLIGRLITGEWGTFYEAALPFVLLAIALAETMASVEGKKEE